MAIQINDQKKYNEWLRNKLQILVYKLDNSADTTISKNGEAAFLHNVCSDQLFKDEFVVFDIGGNLGDYTDHILSERKSGPTKIHIFEPQSFCVEKLQKRFHQNKNVHINHFGLSDKNSSSTIFKNQPGSGLASLYKRNLDYYNLNMAETEPVLLKRGDDYCTEHKIGHINLMKVDVEGHELSVFSGFGEFFTTDNIDLVQFEYGGANLDSKSSLLELFEFFTKKGFLLTKIMRSGLEKRSYHPRLENFVYQNWVAVSPRLI